MRTRVIADLNPCYPCKGERRYALFRVDVDGVTRFARPTYTSRQAAEKRACVLQVQASLAELGIIVESNHD